MSQRVFIFEFVAGGGWQTHFGSPPPASLLREGVAMLAAIAEDFASANFEVVSTISSDLPDFADPRAILASQVRWARVEPDDNLARIIAEQSARCDWVLIIAPEFGGLLESYCQHAATGRARSLNCSRQIIQLCADKQATAEFLIGKEIRVPLGIAISKRDGMTAAQRAASALRFPAILKPRWGAGSQEIRLMSSAREVLQVVSACDQEWRLEEFCPGRAASVGFLCGPAGVQVLPPCEQLLSEDGCFTYRGGRCRIPDAPAARAIAAALPAIRSLGSASGFVGVDLVLGDAADGSQDFVIEINPRLTTSYVGLRQLARCNLAKAMVAIAAGQRADLEFDTREIEFVPERADQGMLTRRGSKISGAVRRSSGTNAEWVR